MNRPPPQAVSIMTTAASNMNMKPFLFIFCTLGSDDSQEKAFGIDSRNQATKSINSVQPTYLRRGPQNKNSTHNDARSNHRA